MNTRNLRLAAAAAVAALAAGCAIANGQTPQQAETMQLTAKPSGGSALDLGRKGVSIGDQFFEHGKVSGDASGTFQLVTQLVAGNARHGTEQNGIALLLPGGQIEAIGVHPTAGHFDLPIVGGTGSYEGAHGVLSVAPGTRGTESVTVKLDR